MPAFNAFAVVAVYLAVFAVPLVLGGMAVVLSAWTAADERPFAPRRRRVLGVAVGSAAGVVVQAGCLCAGCAFFGGSFAAAVCVVVGATVAGGWVAYRAAKLIVGEPGA